MVIHLINKSKFILWWGLATVFGVGLWLLVTAFNQIDHSQILIYCITISYVILLHVFIIDAIFKRILSKAPLRNEPIILKSKPGISGELDNEGKALLKSGIKFVGIIIGVFDAPFLLHEFAVRLVLPSLVDKPFILLRSLIIIFGIVWLLIAVKVSLAILLRAAKKALKLNNPPLWVKLCITGFIIISVTFIFLQNETFKDVDIKFAEFISLQYYTKLYSGENEYDYNLKSNISTMRVQMGETRDADTYLRICLKLVNDMKRLGAKVVVIECPELLQTEEHQKIIEELHATNVVVFVKQMGVNLSNQRLGVNHPFWNKIPVTWGIYSPERITKGYWRESLSPVYRMYPSYAEVGNGNYHDVIFPILKKYYGIPVTVNQTIKENNVTLGDFSFPLFDNTSFLIQGFWGGGYPGFFADYGIMSDSLSYLSAFVDKGIYEQVTDISQYRSKIENKIVFLEMFTLDDWSKSRMMTYLYIEALNGLFNDKFVTRYHSLVFFISFILVVGFIAITLLFRPSSVVWVTFILLGLLVVLQFWLYDNFNRLVEITYPAFTMILMLAVFPALRLSHDKKKSFEEKQRLEKEEKRRLIEELSVAHDMQMGLMPSSEPVLEGFDISSVCKPAEEVGGDYFDYVWLDTEKTKFGIAIVDVSGKAMKAAMTAVMTSGMIYREVGNNESPRSILQKINKPMYLKTEKKIFTAMSFAVIDLTSKLLTFSNAGQMQPILKRDGNLQYVKVEGVRLPLGIQEEVVYGETTVQLQQGDTLIFYTDGIPEAMNEGRELFGFERLEQTVLKLSPDSASDMRETILQEIQAFVGAAKQHDDMTVVVVRVKN